MGEQLPGQRSELLQNMTKWIKGILVGVASSRGGMKVEDECDFNVTHRHIKETLSADGKAGTLLRQSPKRDLA